MKKILQGIIIFLMVLVVGFFGLKDTMIKRALEKELTNSLGTPVRIYGVDYSVFKELLELKGIGIESRENEAYDVVRIGNITTKFDYKEFLNKKLRADKIDIKDIAFNVKTDRKNTKTSAVQEENSVKTNTEKLSQDEIKAFAGILLNNYELFVKSVQNNPERYERARAIFLAATTPVIDKYVDYKIGSTAEEYISEIVKEYEAVSRNIQVGMKEAAQMEWSIEIGEVNISTNLFGKEFKGTISGFSTDKLKIEKAVAFDLNSLSGGETGKISGAVNLYKMEGGITTVINNADITQVKEVADYAKGMAFLNQKIVLNGDLMKITGDVEVKNIILNKESIAKKFFDDKDAVEKITGNVSDRIGDMEISYKYNPERKTLSVNSNIAEEIGIYMGADVSQLKKLERELKDKYGDDIKKGKEEIKSKLEGFLKSFK